MKEISPDDWIIVPDWERFQHYKNRNPLWIKVYAKLLHDPKFLDLSPASRGILMTIWLLYSQESGQVRVKNATRYGGKGVGYYQLISLNDAGFIEFSASKPLATNREVEVERESPQTPLTDEGAEQQLLHRAFDFAADWAGGPSEKFDEALDGLEEELHAELSGSQRKKLWDEALRHDRSTA